MLPKAEERKTDLRNTSIMEVIILVVIVMLIVVTNKSVEMTSLEEEKNKVINKQANLIEMQKERERFLRLENQKIRNENIQL